MNNPVIQNILTRSSVRKYQPCDIDKDTIKGILQCAMAAPTAVNMQPWKFIAITDQKVKEEISDKLPNAKMAKEASFVVIVCGLPGKDDTFSKDYWLQDCSAASENLLLAAHALGYGAIWTGVYPKEDKIKIVREILAIPDDIIPLNIIPVGKPEGLNEPKNKYHEDNIHWESW